MLKGSLDHGLGGLIFCDVCEVSKPKLVGTQICLMLKNAKTSVPKV